MRVVHLIPQFSGGGAEMLLSQLALWQRRAGHEVFVVTMADPEPTYLLNPYRYALEQEVPVITTPGRWRLNPFRAHEADAWRRLLLELNPEIVHSHLYEADGLALSYIRQGTVYCCHVHGPVPPPNSMKEKLIRPLELMMMRRRYAHEQVWFVAISQSMMRYAQKLVPGKDSRRIRVVYNGIDLSRFTFSRRRRPRVPLRLVTVGSLIPRKQHAFLVEVVNRLRCRGTASTLQILGSGTLEGALRQQIRKLGLDDVVTLAGQVSHVEEFLQQADVYVHAAQPEPLGLAVLEAMACGLPAVVLDGGGVSELMEDGRNGALVQQRHVDRFVEAILWLTADEKRFSACSQAARATAERHSLDDYIRQVQEVYEEALRDVRDRSA
ncbi:MAG: glycosyltransferase family 4 protein [Chitinophagales bacterium]|nr:glycosyltransferase family 4 protein [Chitinophagales bacterium]